MPSYMSIPRVHIDVDVEYTNYDDGTGFADVEKYWFNGVDITLALSNADKEHIRSILTDKLLNEEL